MSLIMNPAVPFTLLLLASAVILSSANNSFCSLADDKVLCSQLVKHAKDWNTAITNTLKASLEMTKQAKPITDMIGARLPVQLKPVSKESLDSTCREAYENIVYNLESSIGFVKKNDFGSLKTYLSAISFSDCTDGLNEFGAGLPEADQFASEVQKLCSTLLAVADRKNE